MGFPGSTVVQKEDTRDAGLIPWSRKWQPAPAFLPGKFHGQGSLVSYSLWGCQESDMAEGLSTCLQAAYGIMQISKNSQVG